MRKMIRYSAFLLFWITSTIFSVNAQKKTSEQKAADQASIITKYINSKITDASGHLTASQTKKIETAYADYYNDKAAYKKRKKEFMATYKAWKEAATSGSVSAEEKAKLETQKVEIAKENKALNKETKDMRTRRENKIKEALNDEQEAVFTQMRQEQSSKDDDES